ncbi:hypothetical protein [Legionella sp. WA2024007413]
MSKKLIQNFRTALIHYLKNPYDEKNKKNLTESAFAIYDYAAKLNNSMEPDKYMTSIDNMVKAAVRGIKVHPYLAEVLDSFSRELGMLDQKHKAYAFHVLTITYNWYLRERVIDPKQFARKKLATIKKTIQQLKVTNNPYVEELEAALTQLTALVKQYFKLTPEKQLHEHSVLEERLNFTCAEHRAAITSDVRVKFAFYSFLSLIFSIFDVLGFSLAAECKKTNSFFQEASLTPQNTLSDFRIPFIKVKDNFEDEEQLLIFGIS